MIILPKIKTLCNKASGIYSETFLGFENLTMIR